MVDQKIDNYWAPGGFSYPLFCLSFSRKKERLVSSLSLKQIFSWNDWGFFPKLKHLFQLPFISKLKAYRTGRPQLTSGHLAIIQSYNIVPLPEAT